MSVFLIMATAAYDDGGNGEWLPEKPQKPLLSDCCGTGSVVDLNYNCITFDL